MTTKLIWQITYKLLSFQQKVCSLLLCSILLHTSYNANDTEQGICVEKIYVYRKCIDCEINGEKYCMLQHNGQLTKRGNSLSYIQVVHIRFYKFR